MLYKIYIYKNAHVIKNLPWHSIYREKYFFSYINTATKLINIVKPVLRGHLYDKE